jgi:lysozyme family protein
MKMDFNTAFDRLIGYEGGYADHPADPGGETNWGITLNTARAAGYTGSMRALTRDQAKAIYHTAYWDGAQCGEYPGAIAFQVFDAAVNHGVTQAIRFLQRALGVTADGVVGPDTLAALRSASMPDVLARFNAERLQFYSSLPSWPTFGAGWRQRLASNMRYAAEDAS